MHKLRLLLLLAIGFILIGVLPHTTYAQPSGGTLSYGETVAGIFDTDSPAPHTWAFNANERELVRVTLRRIGGQFTPTMTITAPDGSPVMPTTDITDTNGQVFELDNGTQPGDYTITVNGEQAPNNVINPSEYSLTVERRGLRKPNVDVGLSPLPALGTAPFPELVETAPATSEAAITLEVPVYEGTVSQPDPRAERNRFILTGGGPSVDLNNANPLSRGIVSFSFVDNGVGFVHESDIMGRSQFFTDQDITSMEYVQGITTLTLGNGQQIETDFFRIEQMWAVGNLIALRMTTGQRIILSGSFFDLKRRGGLQGEGPNAEQVNIFTLQNGDRITTDLSGWDTLAYLAADGPQTRVLYGPDARLITTITPLNLLQRGNSTNPDLNDPATDTSYHDVTVSLPDNESLTLNYQLDNMGDIEIAGDTITVRPLDGREISEPLLGVGRLLIEQAGLRFERLDGSFRLSLPDFTDIITPPALPEGEGMLLPTDPAYTPQGLNNLGADLFDFHPAVALTDALMPVNRVNGNFYYPVEELNVPSHTLTLQWERHYNSLAPADQTPTYIQQSPTPGVIAGLGDKWRHTYQYQLDITYAPLGQVRVILPDGATHVFQALADTPNRFTSSSLRSWIIDRADSLTGDWRATTTEGTVYQFDRAGRLQRITDAAGHSLLFSPAPRQAVEEVGAFGGFFVTEPYGRRFELYTNQQGQIVLVRDAEKREIVYTYRDGALVGVQYIDAAQQATYSYESGYLTAVDDTYSPYHQTLTIQPNPEGRVLSLVRNPDATDAPAQTIRFDYGTPNQVLEQTTVNGQERFQHWRHDNLFRLTEQAILQPGNTEGELIPYWVYGYEYSPQTQRLSEIIQPDASRMALVTDERGYLQQLEDPRYRGVTNYRFTYTSPDGYRQLLTQIDYPAVDGVRPQDTFVYNEAGRLIERTQLIAAGREPITTTTRYTYDSWGRLETVTRTASDESGGEDVTTFAYDDFGYPLITTSANNARLREFRHDIVGRLLRFTDGRGVDTALIWNLERNLITGLQVSGTDANVSYTYDERNNITTIIDRGITTNFTYNSLNQVVSLIDGDGQPTFYEYDEIGNLLRTVLPDDLTNPSILRYTYDRANRLQSVISPNDLVTRYETTTDRESSQTRHRVTDPTGDYIDYIYDSLGRIVQVRKIDRNGIRVFDYGLNYDQRGRLTTVQEIHVPDGRTLSLTYDLLDKPLTTAISQTRMAYTYDAFGRLNSVTLPGDDPVRSYTYQRDALGNITTAIYPDGTPNTYSYDENSNLTTFEDGLDRETTYSYDNLNRLIGILQADASRISYDYDEFGNLVTFTDPRGNQTLAEYDSLNRLVRIQDPAGIVSSYEYDPLSRLQRVQIAGNATSYTYDKEGNVVAVTPPETRAILYGYDGLGRVTSTTNAIGHSTIYSYNSLSRISNIIDPLGNEQNYGWSASGRMRFFSTPNDKLYEYAYDGIGRLTRITDRAAEATPFNTVFGYDAAGFLNDIQFATDNDLNGPNSTRHRYTYDANGRIISYTPPESDLPWLFEYDAAGQLVRAIAPTASQDSTQYTYDAVGNITAVTHPDGSRASYEYDAGGNITRYTAPDGLVSAFTYDENNRLVRRVDNADGNPQRTQTFGYDDQGNLTLWVDPAGNRTVYRYDTSGRVRLIERPLGEDGDSIQYRYTYDPVGNLTQILLPNNSDTQNADINMTYNNLNQRIRYVDQLANVWAYTYDAENNLIQVNDPLGSPLALTYDGANRLTQMRLPTGNLVRLRYDLGAYQRGFVSPRIDNGDEINDRERITYTMDKNGNIVRIEHTANEFTTFTRDNMGNVTQRTDGGGPTTAYTYDSMNRFTGMNAPDLSARVAYDAAGRITSISSNESRYDYSYDVFGNVTTVSGDVEITYTYDAIGNVTSRDAGEFGVLTYTYDELYRPTRIEKDGSGIDITYVSDNENQRQRNWVASITRDNSASTNYAYDANGRIEQILHLDAAGTPADILNYTYDAVGNINRVTRLDEWTVIYSYDAAHQVISERWLNPQNQTTFSTNFRYDDAGNRIERTERRNFEAPVRTRYEYNNKNQLTREIRNFVPPQEEQILWLIGGVAIVAWGMIALQARRRRHPSLAIIATVLTLPLSVGLLQQNTGFAIDYTYDTRGNTTAVTYPDGGGLQLSYDSQNRLTRINGVNTRGDNIDTAVTYNAFSQVHTITDNIADTRYRLYYDGANLIGVENVLDGTLQTYFTPFDGERHRIDFENGDAYWMLDDALGNVRKLLNADGTLVAPSLVGYNFNAFGMLITPYGADEAYRFNSDGRVVPEVEGGTRSVPPGPSPLFREQLYDPSSELYIMGVRAYDADLGRFIQRDPVRHDPQGTLYTYAYNRPGRFIDPQGTTPYPARQAIEAVNIPTDIKPDNAPPPLLPDVPLPEAIHNRQAQEMHRPLQLAHDLQYTLNDVVGVLSPSLCEFHIRQVNPITESNREQLAAPVLDVVNTFDPVSGWMPPDRPNPNEQVDPFAQLKAALTTLETTQTAGKLWRESACGGYLHLPQNPTPQAVGMMDERRVMLVDTLTEIALYPTTAQRTETLTTIDAISSPPIPLSEETTSVIEPEIDIVRPGFFSDLHTDMTAFYRETLLIPSPGAAPLDWRSGTNAIDVSPPLYLQLE